jgi:hypothetical protein
MVLVTGGGGYPKRRYGTDRLSSGVRRGRSGQTAIRRYGSRRFGVRRWHGWRESDNGFEHRLRPRIGGHLQDPKGSDEAALQWQHATRGLPTIVPTCAEDDRLTIEPSIWWRNENEYLEMYRRK